MASYVIGIVVSVVIAGVSAMAVSNQFDETEKNLKKSLDKWRSLCYNDYRKRKEIKKNEKDLGLLL